MIRINLLPVKKAHKRELGRRQLLVMGAAVLVSIIAVVLVHMSAQADLDALLRDNAIIEKEIARLKAELGDYDKIKAQREEMLKQRKTIQDLQSGRTGPVNLMRELSEILTLNKGPTFDRIQYEQLLRRDPNAGFNATWDPRRVWLDSFDEEKRSVKIKGRAKSNEDVAEFLKRLQLSVFFTDVTPESTSSSPGTGIEHVTFNLSARVEY